MKTVGAATVLLGVLCAGAALAEEAATVVVTHARVHVPGNRPPLEDATVVLANGKVQAVGRNVPVPAGARVIDGRVKIVTPGLIDANTTVGTVDIELEPFTNDAEV